MPEAPVVWGDYEVHLDRLLGRGGMGSVYEARQISLDRRVAVKILDTHRAPSEELAEGFLEKFEVEAKALAKLNDPRIITILQAGRADGKCWYAMELVEGETVDQRISRAGAFEPREAARVAAEAARALAAALAQGIVHRDVKPANIFLTPDGRVKLGDFGLARSGGFKPTRFTEMNAVAGTPEYASPEQAANGACDHRSDQYSLGAVLFEMVTERPPFGGANAIETFFKHAHEPPPVPSRLNPAIPPALEAVILRCLEKDPDRRYPDYASLLVDLEAILVAPIPAPPPPPPERPTLFVRTAFTVGVALVVFVIWGAARLLGGESPPAKSDAPVIRAPEPPAPVAAIPPPSPPTEEVKADDPKTPTPEPLDVKGVADSARKAAWVAADRGDAVALAEYLKLADDPKLADELAGISAPFDHPGSRAFEREVRAIYGRRAAAPVSFGETRSWKPYPGSSKAEWAAAEELRIRDRESETWIAKEAGTERGFVLTFRFAPDAADSWAGVAVSPMKDKSFRMVHLLAAGSRRIASLVTRSDKKAEGRGELEIEPADQHEFAVVVVDGGRTLAFVDGRLVGWEQSAGPGDRLSIGVMRGEVVVTELRIAR
jgi:serine/threonine protein kinase